MRHAAASLVRTLATLRWIAVAAQAVAILVTIHGFGIPLPAAPLWAGTAALACFNLLARHRLRSGHAPSPAEAVVHVLVDIAVLAWLVAWSGGIANPFASLFLLPVALAAMSLPVRWVLTITGLAIAGYLLAVGLAPPLPHLHHAGLDLHLAGMAVNFLLSVLLVAYFLTRLTSARDAGERELATLRERFARNEGIVALATHAASVAHALNTPLATMGLLLDDIDTSHLPEPLRQDVATLQALVATCSQRVRSLADPADPASADTLVLDRLLDQWALMRPATHLQREGNVPDTLALDRSIGHLLLVLLNNAADAGRAHACDAITLRLDLDATCLHGAVRDHGQGFAHHGGLPILFQSDKPDGLGVGLALSHAALEQMGGRLWLEACADGGTCVHFSAPRDAAVPARGQATAA